MLKGSIVIDSLAEWQVPPAKEEFAEPEREYARKVFAQFWADLRDVQKYVFFKRPSMDVKRDVFAEMEKDEKLKKLFWNDKHYGKKLDNGDGTMKNPDGKMIQMLYWSTVKKAKAFFTLYGISPEDLEGIIEPLIGPELDKF